VLKHANEDLYLSFYDTHIYKYKLDLKNKKIEKVLDYKAHGGQVTCLLVD